jgi:DNA recombination protein RmuC
MAESAFVPVLYVLLALLAALAFYLFSEWRKSETLRMTLTVEMADAKARASLSETLRGERDQAIAQREEAQDQAARLKAELAAVESAAAERAEAVQEREQALISMKQEVERSFQALAAQALDASQKSFLTIANEKFKEQQASATGGMKELVKPVEDAFKLLSEQVQTLQTNNQRGNAAISEQMRLIGEGLGQTQQITAKLANALRAAPKARGRWGEETLRNVLELAGLAPHIDFQEQNTVDGETGKLRPDVVIRLPDNRALVVDSKVALSGYLDAMDATDEAARENFLKKHAQELKAHVKALGEKEYWRHVPDTADFVVLFIPGENFFAAAAEREPNLLQDALARKVIIATPSTMLALAKAVAFGWRQQDSVKNAQEIANLGSELYKRLATMSERLATLGGTLEKSMKSYNELVGNFEARVLPQARRFKDLGAGDIDTEIPMLEPKDIAPRLPAPQSELDLGLAPSGKRKIG